MQQHSHLILLMVALLACAALLLVLWKRLRATRSIYCAAPFLSAAETVFFRQLLEIYTGLAVVCPKVRLRDLIRPVKGLDRSKYQGALNRISSKHVDFVILRIKDLSVLGVVELDDSSHLQESRANRDIFVDDALRQAGIRVRVQPHYDMEELRARLNTAFADE
jgi:hypothetical protein